MTTGRGTASTILGAVASEDLYGAHDGEAARRRARRTLRILRARVHPDRAVEEGLDREVAHAAFVRLGELYDVWLAADAAEERRATAVATVVGERGRYPLGDLVAVGTWSNLYAAGPGRVAKVARTEAAAPRAATVVRALRTLGSATAPGTANAWLAPSLPRLLDAGEVVGPDGRRAAVVLREDSPATGFVSLEQVRLAHGGGLDGRDWAWMARRILRALVGVHELGLVHGAVVASNVLIHPEQHGVVLAGWGTSTRPGSPVPATIASHAEDYPPEVGGAVGPGLDVWMFARLMQRMLRPSEARQLRFAAGCLQVSPSMRPSALDLTREYDDLLERTYGPRVFRPFAMPTTVGTTAAPA
ncbi:protein kinase family protein [Serinibacter arcticus]|uniref:Adenylate cyclase n=1 Tax=Serinibacter arcticus TaxID=1655435 RepID=A0A4Z1E4F6_9MICO|nr:protein kinase family protein [Serinibacter arcticus]TGO04627.1 Adenylate cyclase [Serinibacter arcticus]